jgi:hypothetical protein
MASKEGQHAPATSWASLRADLAAMPDEDLRKLWEPRFGPYVRQQTSELVREFVRTGEMDIARQFLDAALQGKENAGAPMPLLSVAPRLHGPGRPTEPWKIIVLFLMLMLPCWWFGSWLWGITGSDFRLLAVFGFFAVLCAEFFAALGVFRIIEAIKRHRRR